jgi:hypothetical protein
VSTPNACAYSPAGSTLHVALRSCGRLPPLGEHQVTRSTTRGRDREPRDREHPLKVVVSAAERSEIQGRARATGLSTSAYLRSVGLGYEPRSVYDLDAVAEFAQVNGDLGRISGLLKLWLAERAGHQGTRVADVERLLHETRELQQRMLALMSRV